MDGTKIVVRNPTDMPDPGEIDEIPEPYVSVMVVTPSEYIGTVMQLCQERRGELKEMHYLSPERVEIRYHMPLGEIIFDFFDQLKSGTKGYASLDYEPVGLNPSNLVRVDVLAERAAGRRVLDDRPPGQGLRLRQDDDRAPAQADPAADVRRADPGGDRIAGHRPRDGEGEAQGRHREVLRR